MGTTPLSKGSMFNNLTHTVLAMRLRTCYVMLHVLLCRGTMSTVETHELSKFSEESAYYV